MSSWNWPPLRWSRDPQADIARFRISIGSSTARKNTAGPQSPHGRRYPGGWSTGAPAELRPDVERLLNEYFVPTPSTGQVAPTLHLMEQEGYRALKALRPP